MNPAGDGEVELLPDHAGARRFTDVNLIADPLYGYIEITNGAPGEAGERTLIDSGWLQRLRRIHQLQSAWWVFPSGEHSRFVHLLGAMHLASLFARRIDESLRAAFPDAPSPACVEETLRLAGLLHDVGHGPFGHFFDREVLSRWNVDHEVVGRHLVENELGEVIASLRSSPSGRFAPGESVDPRWVSWVMADAEIEGYHPPEWLRACKPILCGPATIDNLDYVRRDAHVCGIAPGNVDVQRLIHYSFIADGTMVLHIHAAGALQMFLASRLHMYTQVYHHRTVRRFDLAMHEIFAATVDQILPGNPLEADHLPAYQRLTDWSLLEAAQRWSDEPAGTVRRCLGDAWGRLLRRELSWHLAYEMVVRQGVDLGEVRERLLALLPTDLRGRVEVDVVTARIAPLNPMTETGFVVLYDPLTGNVERTRAASLIERLPQHNQLLRVFTNDAGCIPGLHAAARRLLD